MSQPLRFTRKRPKAPPTCPMTLGDVLYRIALIAPDRYRGFEVLAREIYKDIWPIDADVIELLEKRGLKR